LGLWLRPFSINVRFARAGEAFIVFDARHARVSVFSKPVRSAPSPARAQMIDNTNNSIIIVLSIIYGAGKATAMETGLY
jgi:hypothetical protein